MFEIKGAEPQWATIYGRLRQMSIGDIVSYEELSALLPDAAEGSWRGAFHRAVREMEEQHKRSFDNVRNTGYRMVAANEHERLARAHHKRAKRQLKTSVRKAHSADRSKLTREERARLDAIELNLSRQVELTRRLEGRVERVEAELKDTRRQQKTDTAALADKVDRLAALLDKHGITAAAA